MINNDDIQGIRLHLSYHFYSIGDFKTFANIIALICVITYQSINKISYNDISTLIFCYHM